MMEIENVINIRTQHMNYLDIIDFSYQKKKQEFIESLTHRNIKKNKIEIHGNVSLKFYMHIKNE